MGLSLSLSDSPFFQSEGEAPFPPAAVYINQSRYGHAVGVIITLEDYNDTPLWTRSPVSTVIKQLLSLWLKGLI